MKCPKVLTIKVVQRYTDVDENNFYIQSVTFNGAEFGKSWLDYTTIMNGGTLEFEMGSEPNKDWGTDDRLRSSDNKIAKQKCN